LLVALSGEIELHAGDLLRVRRKQPTKAVVLRVLVVGPVRRLILKVRVDREASVDVSKCEIVAECVADGARTIEAAKACLDSRDGSPIGTGVQLNQDDVADQRADPNRLLYERGLRRGD
jgi:hypothetical protein